MTGDVNASGDTDGRAWAGRRIATRYDAPSQRPWRETPPDHAAITAWNTAQVRCKDAYNAQMADLEPTDPHVIANRAYRARKAEQ